MGSKLSDAMLGLVASYLQDQGWRVVVIGSPRVQKQPGDAEFHYEFVLRFTGSPPPPQAGEAEGSEEEGRPR